MAATLVRLRWRLTLNAVRSSVWAVIGLLAGGAYAVGAVSVLTGGAVLLGAAGDVTSVSLVLGALGALLVAGWTLVPLLLTGQDGTLDPRALAAWVAPSRTLARGLLVAAACGLPGLATGVVCLLPLLVWALSGQWAAVASALVMAPVALATCVILSRVVVTAAGLSTTRRGRDRVALVAVAAVLLGSLVPSLLNGLALGEGLEALRPVARAVGLTPLGWTFAVPGLVATGQWALAAACALGAVALPVLLMALWYRVVRRVMVTPVSGSGPSHGYAVVTRKPDRSSSAAGSAGDAAGTDADSLVDVLPWARRLGRLMPVPAAAVAARCLRYWRTDPRYLAQLLGLCLVPVLLVVVVAVGPAAGTSVVGHLAWGGAPAGLLALPVVLGLLTGWSLHDDLGYDSTARWSHLSAALCGRDDLLGRIVAAALWQIPVIVVSTLLVAGVDRALALGARGPGDGPGPPGLRLRLVRGHERPHALRGQRPGGQSPALADQRHGAAGLPGPDGGVGGPGRRHRPGLGGRDPRRPGRLLGLGYGGGPAGPGVGAGRHLPGRPPCGRTAGAARGPATGHHPFLARARPARLRAQGPA